MKLLYPRCAGLDVHSETVVAALRLVRGRKVTRDTQTFGTTTKELLRLADWLAENRVQHAVLETTGVFWKPVWQVLSSGVELTLAHASHVKNLPGRKSDVNDAEWLSDLLAHGLVRGGFVPPEPIQELRDLTRTRTQIVRERARQVLRIQKILETANVKLSETISDVLGMSGRRILDAIVAGETDPAKLASLAVGRVRASSEELTEALRGRVTDHHRFMLGLHLRHVDEIDGVIGRLESRILEMVQPFRSTVERLTTMPGIERALAAILIAEVGVDMSRFPTAQHLVSWAGLCPRMEESAGKRRSTRVRKGSPWLKAALVQGAWAAVRVKGSYLQGLYLRIKHRRGSKKAIIAVAASMLTSVYVMLERQRDYKELGIDFLDRRDKAAVANRLAKRIKALGFTVQIAPAA